MKVKLYILLSVFRWFFIAIIIAWFLSVVALLHFCSNSKLVFKCYWRRLHALINYASGRNLGIELISHDFKISLSCFCKSFVRSPSYFLSSAFLFFIIGFILFCYFFSCKTFDSATRSIKSNVWSNSLISGDIPVAFSSFSHSKLNLSLPDLCNTT